MDQLFLSKRKEFIFVVLGPLSKLCPFRRKYINQRTLELLCNAKENRNLITGFNQVHNVYKSFRLLRPVRIVQLLGQRFS